MESLKGQEASIEPTAGSPLQKLSSLRNHQVENIHASRMTADQEASPSLRPGLATTVSTKPFPFLKLPHEVRDMVYTFALISPISFDTGPVLFDPLTHIWYMHYPTWPHQASRSYLGTEQSTRLFRVNRQVSAEAVKVFYSTFTLILRFSYYHHEVRIAHAFNEISSIGARSLIGKVELTIGVDDKKPLVYNYAMEALMELLPNVRRLELIPILYGLPLSESRALAMVENLLDLMRSPKAAMPEIVVRVPPGATSLWIRIVEKLREGLDCSLANERWSNQL